VLLNSCLQQHRGSLRDVIGCGGKSCAQAGFDCGVLMRAPSCQLLLWNKPRGFGVEEHLWGVQFTVVRPAPYRPSSRDGLHRARRASVIRVLTRGIHDQYQTTAESAACRAGSRRRRRVHLRAGGAIARGLRVHSIAEFVAGPASSLWCRIFRCPALHLERTPRRPRHCRPYLRRTCDEADGRLGSGAAR
jgi:hypothetical protein